MRWLLFFLSLGGMLLPLPMLCPYIPAFPLSFVGWAILGAAALAQRDIPNVVLFTLSGVVSALWVTSCFNFYDWMCNPNQMPFGTPGDMNYDAIGKLITGLLEVLAIAQCARFYRAATVVRAGETPPNIA